jgi:hypothetical protein
MPSDLQSSLVGLGISGRELATTAEFRPFIEILSFVGEDSDVF